MSHPRPRLSVFERHRACRRVRELGWTVVAAAVALGVSRQIVHRWLRRFDDEGVAGLADRSSRPHRTPRLTRIDLAVRICVERVRRKTWGPHRLGYLLGMARSTVYAVLRRAGLGRLDALRRREPARRYEWPAPGELVHLDTKRLGKIPQDGASWRNVGRKGANARKRQAGYEYCHVSVDDHSRWPEVLRAADERPASAIAALEATVASYARRGIRIKRVLTDNGNCYRSADFAASCRALGIERWRTRPYHPRTNGKAERFIRTMLQDWAYAELYPTNGARADALDGFLEDYRSRPHTGLDGHAPMCRFTVNEVPGRNS